MSRHQEGKSHPGEKKLGEKNHLGERNHPGEMNLQGGMIHLGGKILLVEWRQDAGQTQEEKIISRDEK